MADATGATLVGEGTGGQAGAGGGEPKLPGWLAALPDELKGNEVLKKYAKPGDFATDALAWKERADKAIVPPGEKATEDERKAYLKALGVPDNKDGYTFDLTKLPKDMETAPDFQAFIKEQAFKAGLSKKQAEAMFFELNARAYESLKAQQAKEKAETEQAAQESAKAEEKLRGIFKDEFDVRVRGAGAVGRALAARVGIAEADFNTWLGENELDKDANMILLLDAVAKLVAPDKLVVGDATTKPVQSSKGLHYPWMREFYGTPQE